jgi:hypothetical protein
MPAACQNRPRRWSGGGYGPRFFWSDGEAGVHRFEKLARRYTSHGYLVELQLRYHPPPAQEGDLDAWQRYVRDVVARFGRNPRVTAIQAASATRW